MSYRTLLEINHDYSPDDKPEFLVFLGLYLRNASRENAKALERYGVRVIGMRHHADKFVIDDSADGFPPTYLKPTP